MNIIPRRFKRGDTSLERPGKVFSCYNGKYERWTTPEHLAEITAKNITPERRSYMRRIRQTPKQVAARKHRYRLGQEMRRAAISRPDRFRSGDTSPSRPGLVFWRYENRGYESWVTPDKLRLIRSKERAASRALRARKMTDPEMAQKVRDAENAYARSIQKKRNEYQCRRRRNNINAAIASRLCNIVASALRRQRVYKTNKTAELVGCSIPDLKRHIESRFKPGMSWENRAEWHIDHRVPLSCFDLAQTDQQFIAFNWRNLQPLWRSENVRKSDKIEVDGQMISVRTLKHQNIIPFQQLAA